MMYGTVCSGVDAVSLAWEPLGMRPAFFSEIEKFPSAVLGHHWPHVPNLGNMMTINGLEWRGKLDILWGSTPCQAFSLAGRRKGVSDPRGALTLKFVDLADEIDPPFVCWENVKGALSDKNNAFGCFLAGLAGEDEPLVPAGRKWTHAGYVLGPERNIAWRLLDAQYGGVPQRRERVFLVACPRDGADPREILFESGSGGQTFAPSRRTRVEDAAALEESLGERAFAAAFRGRKYGEECEVSNQISNCLRASTGGGDKAFALIDGDEPTLRQLTPLECERLMGFPDNHTLVPFGRGMAADGPRYKAIGNSLAVPDVRWLGSRLLVAREAMKLAV